MHDKHKNGKPGIRREARRIGFFAPAGSEYVDRIVEGILRYQNDRGGCEVREFRFDPQEPEDQEKWALRPRPWDSWADGLVVNISDDPGLADWVCAGGEPVVNTGGMLKMQCVCISPDGIAARAIEHFKACGLANFAFVSPLPNTALWQAFDARLKEMGIEASPNCIGINPSRWDFSNEDKASSDAGLFDMLRRTPKPVAILCENDDVGKVVCLAAQRMGFEIPREIAVLGVKNLASSRTSVPPLSSIHSPGDEVGYRAMELLLNLIDGQSVPPRVEIPPGKVVVRQSTSVRGSNEIDIRHVIAVIRERACDGVGIEEILHGLNISQSTLRREFARLVGHTPGEEMARVRLERAEELLQISNITIARVAAATGYASQTNFTTFFKSRTAMTPREYRKRCTLVAKSTARRKGRRAATPLKIIGLGALAANEH